METHTKCLDSNRLQGLRPFHNKKAEKSIRNEIDKLTFTDFEKMKFYFRNDDAYWSQVFTFALNTGMRNGEIYAVKFSDLNLADKEKYIRVNHSYCFTTKKEKSPKNGKSREVPINRTLLNLIEKLRKTATGEYLFERSKDWEHGKAASELRKVQKNILKIPTTSFHNLRALFIVDMLVNGVSPVRVQKIVDHADSKTMDIFIQKANSIVPIEKSTDVLDGSVETDKKLRSIKTS